MKAWALITLLLMPAVAQAGPSSNESPQDKLRTATNFFQFSDYETARRLVEDLIQSNALTRTGDRIEALRIAGLCWYYAHEPDKAEAYFHQLILMDPDYQLDPFYTPPLAVQFFEQTRKKYAEELEAIRARQKASQAEQEARLKASQEAAKIDYRDVEHHDRLLAFLPLGIGQFQNGDTGLGVALGTIQVTTALTSVGSWVALAVMNVQHRNYVQGSPLDHTANALKVTAVATGAAFYATWIYSTVQALSGFQPIREVPGGTRSSGEKSDSNKVSSIAPFVVPTSGGGIAGLGLGF